MASPCFTPRKTHSMPAGPAALFTAWAWLLGPAPAIAASSSPAHLYVAEARTDTLEATPAEIFPAAEKALENDHWTVSKSTAGHRIVTEWKEFHHPLARLFMGNLRARCVVEVHPLDDRHTIVRFQSGLASENDIESNPALAVAQSVYRGAVRDFYRDLTTGIEAQRSGKPSDPTPMDRHTP